MTCITVIAGTIIVRKDRCNQMPSYRTLAEKNISGLTTVVDPLRRAADQAASQLGGFVGNLRSGTRAFMRQAHAAVDPQEAWLQEGERLGRQRASGFIGPTQQTFEVPGVGYFEQRTGRFLGRGPSGRSGADIGGDGRGDEARALLSQYAPKPSFPLTPQGQFDRYFGTSGEMDPYFGAASRGAGAPKNVQDMTALAAQRTALGSTPQDLATYYRAQSAAGRGNMDEIVGGLTYGKAGKEAENLAAWAKANPMLAMREYNKRFPGGQPTMGTGELSAAEALQGTKYQGVGGQGFGEAVSTATAMPMQGAFTPGGNLSIAANAVPAPWNTQGAQVSNVFNDVKPWQAAKTTGEGMPAFQTVGEKAAEFLSRKPISTLF